MPHVRLRTLLAMCALVSIGRAAGAQSRDSISRDSISRDSSVRDSATRAAARAAITALAIVKVTGRADNLTGVAQSASQGRVGRADLRLRPLVREGEILENI
ncbi:MAG: hypothetical protein IT354_14865, partial [Gemmatimonadaceae bacterium]|nr:hypothetical protein [Gemmatimonadaceae bacterium]